eukprot:TRINITY_DN17769_c0_g1_i1.p1 TRINITY_DN17769_c0_g1~~TRINITY_DN17769_c0_g1_i1.p1  ORF type:complete len:1450 (+),score=582.24 TRINITY_DN17769_c0_g1_i1:73-4422(+)
MPVSAHNPRPPAVGKKDGEGEAPRYGHIPQQPYQTTNSRVTQALEVKTYTQSYGVLHLIDDLSGRILEERPTDVVEFAAGCLVDKLHQERRSAALVQLAKRAIAAAEGSGASIEDLRSVAAMLPSAGSGVPSSMGASRGPGLIDLKEASGSTMKSPGTKGSRVASEARVTDEDRVQAMLHNEFFSRFHADVLRELARLSAAFSHQSGGRLYRRGDQRGKLYVILEGLVRLTEERATGFWDLGTFTKGNCLGESAISRPEQKKHRTEAMAVNATTFLVIDVEQMAELMNRRGLLTVMYEAAACVSRNRMRQQTHTEGGVRKERDTLGEKEIPNCAYYGIRTQRAKDIFSASGVSLSRFPNLVKALSMVKKASALANRELGLLDEEKAGAICQACDEVIEGNMHDEFCLDMLQGGAGVSTMANANEVIANRATELLGGTRGQYHVHPNEHVNMSQSDDAYHTVIRLAIISSAPEMLTTIQGAVHTLYEKAWEFRDVIKMGRTMMQDAVPVSMGREFLSYARQLEDDLQNQTKHVQKLQECLLGGTMLGTGLGSVQGFGEAALQYLNEISGLTFRTPEDLVKSMTDMNTVVSFSGGLRRIAVRISKICNDLRLMTSGPRCGLKEIDLPEKQPGSSIMPGKVNPVIPEAMNQVCYQVIGNDVCVTMAAEGAQLNSCIFDTVILFSVLESMQILGRGFKTLNDMCLKGIKVKKERCRTMVENSVSKLTAAIHVLGYDKCSQVAEAALERGCAVEEVLREQQLLSEQQMKELFDLETMSKGNMQTVVPEAETLSSSQLAAERSRREAETERTETKELRLERFTDRLDPDAMEKMDALLRNQVFQCLQKLRVDEVHMLLDMMDRIDLEAGSFLYKAGDERKHMYLLKQGVIRIQKKSSGDDVGNVVAALSDGSSVGETALLECSTLSRHQLNAVAEITSICYSVDLDQLLPHLQMPENKKMAQLIAEQVGAVLYDRLKGVQHDGGLKRTDTDLLGPRQVDISVYWGVQTLRATENFPITGTYVRHFPNLVKAFGFVKKACAISNRDLGLISAKQGDAIIRACDEIIAGKLADQFPTDMIQGGAGTSTNMNANEVIANRANEILGDRKGTYKYVHPNDHVNKSQSTNDSYPTSLRLSIVMSAPKLIDAMTEVADALRERGVAFDKVVKMGRTQLQDAVPMTLGQEFFSLSRSVEDDIALLRSVTKNLQISNLGGTAIGTGLCADRDFPRVAVKRLTEVTGIPFQLPKDLIQASSDTSGMLTFSNTLKRIALKMSKICNDFRLLSSGPKCGIGEIELPCVQPMTSLIPGKNDPDIPEMVTMCAYRVVGSDTVCAMAAHAAQLQLNVMEPVMIYRILASIDMLSSAFNSLSRSCITRITANERNCKNLVQNSIGIVTALLPTIGYKNCSRAAAIANKTGKSLCDVLLEEGMMTREQLDAELVPEKMVTAAKMARRSGDE